MAAARKRSMVIAPWLLVAILLVVITTRDPVIGGPPANKAAAQGGATEIVGANDTVQLFSKTIRTSNPQDLILQVTLECALVTDVTTVGDAISEATSQLKVWVEIDGTPVVVGTDDEDAGKVTFCNRTYRRETSGFTGDDSDNTIATYFKTRSTHAFNWIKLNTGSGIHEVKVYGQFLTAETGNAHAEAVVGNRTFVIDPAHFAQDADLLAS